MGKQSARKGKAQRVKTCGIPNWLIGAGLGVLTLTIYAQVIGHQFIALDDDLYITDNPMVNGGVTLARLSSAFTTFHQANWHPLTWIAQAHGGAVRTFTDVPIGLRLSNALISYAKYVLLTFWPNDLAVYYPFALEGIPMWQIIGAVVPLSAITAFCVFQRKIRPYLVVG